MRYKEFNKVIGLMVKHNNKLRRLNSEFKLDMVEMFEEHNTLIEMLWNEVLTDNGLDWVSWYLYDKDGISGKLRGDINAYDGGVEICRDLRGLYNYLWDNKYFKNQI